MARVRPLETYPLEFFQIVKGCSEHRQYANELPSMTKALSLQGKFYAFRQALSRAAINDPVQAGLLSCANDTICWIDKGGWTAAGGGVVKVMFVHKDEHPDSKLLREFKEVGQTPIPEQESVETSFMTRLRELENPDGTGATDDRLDKEDKYG